MSKVVYSVPPVILPVSKIGQSETLQKSKKKATNKRKNYKIKMGFDKEKQ